MILEGKKNLPVQWRLLCGKTWGKHHLKIWRREKKVEKEERRWMQRCKNKSGRSSWKWNLKRPSGKKVTCHFAKLLLFRVIWKNQDGCRSLGALRRSPGYKVIHGIRDVNHHPGCHLKKVLHVQDLQVLVFFSHIFSSYFLRNQGIQKRMKMTSN